MAQVIRIIGRALATSRQATLEGWSWQKIDRGIIKEGAKQLRIIIGLSSLEALDRAVDDLIRQLQEIANKLIPRKRLTTGRSAV